MAQEINIQALETKILLFFEQFNRKLKLIKDYEAIKKSYYALFSDNSAYDYILERAKITKENTRLAIKLLPLTDLTTFNTSIFMPAKACPAFFHFERTAAKSTKDANPREVNGLGLNLRQTAARPEKEFCLLFDELGNFSLLAYLEDRTTKVYSFLDLDKVLFLNLPLLLQGLVNSQNFVKEKLLLETIAQKNPISLLASLYTFVVEQPAFLPSLSKTLLKFNRKILATNYQFEPTSLFRESFLETTKEFLVEAQTNVVPYSLFMEKNKISLRLNFRSTYMAKRYFSQYGETFPIYVLFEGLQVKPYFIRHQAFRDKITKGFLKQKPSLTLEGGNLCTLEEKTAEEESKTTASTLNENVKLVLATLAAQMEKSLTSRMEIEQEIELAKILKIVETCKKTSEELVRLFEEIYKKEILLELL